MTFYLGPERQAVISQHLEFEIVKSDVSLFSLILKLRFLCVSNDRYIGILVLCPKRELEEGIGR